VCIDLQQTGSVGEGSDHLQLIKFWPSCAPGKGVCAGMGSRQFFVEAEAEVKAERSRQR